MRKAPKQIEYLWGFLLNSLHSLAPSDARLSKKIATKIKSLDNYYGYLAWSEVFFKEKNHEKAIELLNEMILNESARPEAYYRLWKHYYDKQEYFEAEDVAAQAFVKITNIYFTHYFVIFCISYAKSYEKLGKLRGALELLQQKYIEHPKIAIFLYHYARLAVKNAEEMFLVCGITALEECLRACDVSLHGKVWFWLGKAFLTSDRPLKAHSCFTKALKMLNPNQKKKISEINLALGRLDTLVTKLTKLESSKILLSANEISSHILETHSIEGLLAVAKSIWSIDKVSAVEFLLENKKKTTRCDYFFLLFHYLKMQKDVQRLKSETKRQFERCKKLIIPTSDWVLCHIWYAKALALSNKPEKSIFLLKCIGKVVPELPYLEVRYTKALSNASTVSELLEAHSIYHYFHQSVHIVSNAYLNTLASQDVPLFLQEKRGQAHVIYAADSVIESSCIDSVSHFSTLSNEDKNMRPAIHRSKENRAKAVKTSVVSQKFEDLLKIREKSGFVGFSLCSDPYFLLCIAKVSWKHGIDVSDGLCAVEDYLEIVEDPVQRLKASFFKAMLLVLKQKDREAAVIMHEILPMLKKEQLMTKYNQVKAVLDRKS